MAADVYGTRERALDMVIPADGGLFGVRLDGRAFHTFTKRFDKPFDRRVTSAMDDAAKTAFSALGQCVVAYTQSDEISLIYSCGTEDERPFNLRVQKVVSTLASTATAGFVTRLTEFDGLPPYPNLPTFDGRVFTLDDAEDVLRYLSWRRAEGKANAVSAAATHVFGHSALVGKSDDERMAMLRDSGVGTALLGDRDFYGAMVTRREWHGDIEWRDGDGVVHTAHDVLRHKLIAEPPVAASAFEDILLKSHTD